jgi:hypothetical protein
VLPQNSLTFCSLKYSTWWWVIRFKFQPSHPRGDLLCQLVRTRDEERGDFRVERCICTTHCRCWLSLEVCFMRHLLCFLIWRWNTDEVSAEVTLRCIRSRAHYLTDWLTDWPTDRQTDLPTDWLTAIDWLTRDYHYISRLHNINRRYIGSGKLVSLLKSWHVLIKCWTSLGKIFINRNLLIDWLL